MTYSIVARDAESGEIGVAVQTAYFAVGALVPWARAGVGAVASQAIAEPAYGPRCLTAMRDGATAADALAAGRASDGGAALRQVGVVDARGNAAAFTGELCIDAAGHHIGDGYTVQANMMASADVWPAMARAYADANGPLAERLLASLQAAQRAGGDARGAMSAAILVVAGDAHDDSRLPLVDLRVDAHEAPLDELARLLSTERAYAHLGRGTDALFAGTPELALAELDRGLALLPDDENMRFTRAGALLFSGDVDAARAAIRALIDRRPTWELIVRSFAAKGLLAVPDGLDVDSFLSE